MFQSRAFRFGFAYQQLGLIALSIAFYVMRPDWMWMYWVPSATLPIAVIVLCFAVYEAMFIAGFAMAPSLAGRGLAIPAIVANFALLTVAQVATRNRLSHFGTITDYAAGHATRGVVLSPLSVVPELWVFAIGGTASVVSLIALLRFVARRAADGTPAPACTTKVAL